MSYLLISLVPPIADIDGISYRISQSELSQRFTPRFTWCRKYNQEWQVLAEAGWMRWDVILPVWRYCRLPKDIFTFEPCRAYCIAFGCNNTAFAAQLKLSDAAHARLTAQKHAYYHYRVLCIRDVTYLVHDTGIVEFVLRAFNNYFLHNGVINCIHSKI